MTPLEQTIVNYTRVGLSNNGKFHIEVDSSTTADGYAVTETGIVLYYSNGTPALELLLENIGGDIKNGKAADVHYGANIHDNGNGVFVHGYAKISDGTNEYVKYTYNLYSTLEDVTHAPASGISQPITIMPLVYKKAMHFTGLTSAFYRPALYPIYTENTATVENSKTIPIYSNGSNLTDYSFEGQCSQASTPTPSVPVDVQEFGEITGNLFDVSDYSVGGKSFITKRITLEPNTAYTMSSNCPLYNVGALIAIGNVGESFTTANNGVYPNHPISRTTDAKGELVIGLRTNGSNYTPADYETMLNTGNTALPYEPYGKYKIPITSAGQTQNIILSEPLRKIGNHADTIESDGVVTRRIKKLKISEIDVSWVDFTVNNIAAYRTNSDINKLHGDGIFTMLSNSYKVVNLRTGMTTNFTIAPYNNTNSSIICVRDDRYTTASEWLAENGDVELYYVLATPTTESVTAPTIPTSSGFSNITIGTSLAPSKFEYDLGKMFIAKGQGKVRQNGEWV